MWYPPTHSFTQTHRVQAESGGRGRGGDGAKHKYNHIALHLWNSCYVPSTCRILSLIFTSIPQSGFFYLYYIQEANILREVKWLAHDHTAGRYLFQTLLCLILNLFLFIITRLFRLHFPQVVSGSSINSMYAYIKLFRKTLKCTLETTDMLLQFLTDCFLNK